MFDRFKKVNFLFVLIIVFLFFGGIFLVKSDQIPSTPQRISSSPSVPPPPTTPFFTMPSLSSGRQPMSIGDIAGWHQVFADDFNATTLNTANWEVAQVRRIGETVGTNADEQDGRSPMTIPLSCLSILQSLGY